MKKLVIAAMLLFAMGVEMQAQDVVMRAYDEYGRLRFQRSTSLMDSVTFVEMPNSLPDPYHIDYVDPYITGTAWKEYFEMALVKSGTFLMGEHEVTITKDFYIGKYEVPTALWVYVMAAHPDKELPSVGPFFTTRTNEWNVAQKCQSCPNQDPVWDVSWYDIDTVFLPRLNKLTGLKFRLPTEAEWKYAARGGQAGGSGLNYAGSNVVDDVAWYSGNASATHAVGGKAANELGLRDMSGNVYEWTSTIYSGSYRVLRGGGWTYDASYCEVSYRHNFSPGNRYGNYGFRLVLVP
jgi:formylglycine-generating enzyme required for sulfatase activity